MGAWVCRGGWGISAEGRPGACDVSVARAARRWSPGRARAVRSPKGLHIFWPMAEYHRMFSKAHFWPMPQQLEPIEVPFSCNVTTVTSSEKAYHCVHCKGKMLNEFCPLLQSTYWRMNLERRRNKWIRSWRQVRQLCVAEGNSWRRTWMSL